MLAVRKAGHVVIVHRGEVFFNTWDEPEARKWEDKGAILVPHWEELELAIRRKKKVTTQGWEVHFLGALTRIELEDVDGDLVDVTKDELLAAARDKVPA